MKGMIDMRKKMKIGPRVAIITSAMILAGSMAACGNTKDTDNKITTATVTDASVMDGAENTSGFDVVACFLSMFPHDSWN